MHRQKGVIEAFWDCPQCNTKRIGGLTKKCPNCGYTVGEGQKYYIRAITDNFLTEDQIPKGEEWQCSFCGSYNPHDAEICQNCGASYEDGINYFNATENKKRELESKAKEQEEWLERNSYTSKASTIAQSKAKRFIFFALIFSALIVFWFLSRESESYGEIIEKSWNRTVAVEELTNVEESGWTLPEDAELIASTSEVKSYRQEIIGYTTVYETHTRQVQDGEVCHDEAYDNGNGTYSIETVCQPNYVTETYQEPVEKPVFEQVPEYATKYFYKIDKWLQKDMLKAEGVNNEPYWPEAELSDTTRYGEKTEEYYVVIRLKNKDHTTKISEREYYNYIVGDSIDCRTNKLGHFEIAN